jgi:hypothetical protein
MSAHIIKYERIYTKGVIMPPSKDAIKRASNAYKERTKQAGIDRKSLWIKLDTYAALVSMSADMSATTGNKKPVCMAEILEKVLNKYMSADMSATTKKARAKGKTGLKQGQQRKWNKALLHRAKTLKASGLKPIEVYNKLANEYPENELPSKPNIARWLDKQLPKLIEQYGVAKPTI